MKKAVRLKVKHLDKNRCRAWGCRETCNLEIHHIIPKGVKRVDETWNLIALCSFHHNEITTGKVTNIQLLDSIKRTRKFRWNKALQWWLDQQLLKEVKHAKSDRNGSGTVKKSNS